MIEKEKELISTHELSDKRMVEIQKLGLDLNYAREESRFLDQELNELKNKMNQLQHEYEEAADLNNKQLLGLSERNENLIVEVSDLSKQNSCLNEEIIQLKIEKIDALTRENNSKKDAASNIILLSNEIKRLSNRNELMTKEMEIASKHVKLLQGRIKSKASFSNNVLDLSFKNKKVYEETNYPVTTVTASIVGQKICANNDYDLIQSQVSLSSDRCKSFVINKIDNDMAGTVETQIRKNTYQRKKVSKPSGLGKGKFGFMLDDLEVTKMEDLFDDEIDNRGHQAKLSDTGLDISEVNKCPSQAINCLKSDEESLCNYHLKHVCTEELVNLHPTSSYKPLKSSINRFNERIVTTTNASTNFTQSELRKYWESQARICYELSIELTSSYSDYSFFSRLFELYRLNNSNPDHFILINRSRLYNKAKERRVPFFKFGDFIMSELDNTLETLNIKKKINVKEGNATCINTSSNLSFRASQSGSRNPSTTSILQTATQKTLRESKPEKALAYFSNRFV